MNLPRWQFTLDTHTPPWAMDARHVDMLAAVVRLSGVKSVVEIGCLNGRSTTAFVEAAEAGAALEWLGLCDREFTRNLFDVAAQMPKSVVVETHAGMSQHIHWHADLWMIDGDHLYEGVRDDVALARRQGAKILVLHDTSHRQFDGPRRVLEEIRGEFAAVFHDDVTRPGEETERGMAFCFSDYSQETAACLRALDQLAKC